MHAAVFIRARHGRQFGAVSPGQELYEAANEPKHFFILEGRDPTTRIARDVSGGAKVPGEPGNLNNGAYQVSASIVRLFNYPGERVASAPERAVVKNSGADATPLAKAPGKTTSAMRRASV